ncbi:P-loop containing nucleoside triphosphate hydrolase protein [Schizophyllum amplum]|uniref:P-loop containing nucleoside triphosphate hydrolase protein n=1 Tax=Schizophyllum amplum TaxID=97359 RepID=A0A550CUF2_9AGAR|nr:P-loop containing nucleoside triphosphate hydrolase protein [Auriculariopsis ampla]
MVAAGSITVAVRVRPPTSWEAQRLPEPCYDTTLRGDGALSTPGRANTSSMLRNIVEIIDDRILTFDPQERDPSKAFMERGFLPPGTKRYKDKRFMFDRVFDHEARQQDVYDSTARPLLKNLLDGYNATVFAYGATGCGKTHTISGTETDPGIIYLTMADLFQRIEERKEDYNVDVMVTFLEIYNEEIRDLLAEPGTQNPRGGLCIREDKAVKVVGLAELKPQSADEVKEIVLLGNSRRTQSPTHANETSSRSHAVLQVHVTQSPRTANITEQKTCGTLSIIDLAGSERAAATSNMGQRMVEGANINKSLLALGNCINALCESGGAVRHVPYRNSKLTRLLKFSLGGNCKTVMIVCVAPTSQHFDDTHNTLVYAERATRIKTKVVTRNVVNVNRHVGQYVEAINRLNLEIAELKQKLSGKQSAETDVVRRKKAEATAEVQRAKSDMHTKHEQTQVAIVDGAHCSGRLAVATTRLAAIQQRLDEIAAMEASSSSPLPADLFAERAILQTLAKPEEEAVAATSNWNVRLQRSSNASAMFDATMRAVSERRSDRLDDVSVENVKLDARCHRAEIEKEKAEAEREVLKEAVRDISQLMVGLAGIVGRCTVKIGDASKTLSSAVKNDAENLENVVKRVSGVLGTIKEKNDEALSDLVGHTTADYTSEQRSLDVYGLSDFKGYGAAFTRRISSGPAVLQSQAGASSSRRASLYETQGHEAGSPRRRAPRKSLRTSIASQPYRRAPERERKVSKGKNVQWKDEAGQGALDMTLRPDFSMSLIPASPAPPAANLSTASASGRNSSMSMAGSESDWEDVTAGGDESFAGPSGSNSGAGSTPAQASASAPPAARKRPSRLDPSFLKSRKGGGPALGSLAEADEAPGTPRRGKPLSDRSNNQPEESISAALSHRGKAHGSPGRRAPPTPRAGGRRRSGIGLMRGEKGRRRSSMIPQLSPPSGGGGPRRVMIGGSPAKRVKRPSMAARPPLTSFTAKLRSAAPANTSVVDPNMSVGDTSFRLKPTWR